MAIPALPASGSTDWYAWASGVDDTARNASPISPLQQVGEWQMLSNNNIAGFTFTASQLTLSELILVPGTYDSTIFQVTTAGTSATTRVGIYSDTAGKPNALLYESAAIDSSTTGSKQVTGMSLTFTSTTRIWIGLVPQTANVAYYGTNLGITPIVRTGTPSGDLWYSPFPAWVITGVTATLPSSASAAARTGQAPRVGIRRSA